MEMPWKEVSPMSEKEFFVKQACQPDANITQLCADFGISRPTGYELLKRYKKEGKAGLQLRSRRPKTSPHKTPEEIEDAILLLRDKHPKWGGDKIRSYLMKQGLTMPNEKTIDRILKRHGRVTIEESLKRKTFIRFEHEHPNDLWQMDFKGHFKLNDGLRCHPLTLLDDHSRFSLEIRSCQYERFETVKPALIGVFREYGLPLRMTMDNGAPWGCSSAQLHTKLTTWLIMQGIIVLHSRPRHPQTQGKLERFHRTLKAELISEYMFDNLAHAQQGFDWWRQIYNDERPHAAIEMQVPSERYKRSAREYVENPSPYIYDSSLEIRKVGNKGNISYHGRHYTVGEGFAGYHVGLKPTKDERIVDVYFCHQKVLKIDLEHALKY